MEEKHVAKPFEFVSCYELREMLGKTAWDERELLELIEEIPLDSIYYHTHSYFLRHTYLLGPYPNDFATWAAIHAGDTVLGEKLGGLVPLDFESLEDLRGEIISIIDDHLSRLHGAPRTMLGEPFFFMRSRIIEMPANIVVETLKEFREALEIVDAGAIYFHIFEAIMRQGRKKGDFAAWLDHELGLPELSHRVLQLDPYMMSLENLRSKLLAMCDAFLKA